MAEKEPNVKCPTPTLTNPTIQRSATEQQSESESEFNTALKEVKYLNVSTAQGNNSALPQKVYPTLRLRLLHSNALEYKDSIDSGTARQAVTQPRRIRSSSSHDSNFWLQTQHNVDRAKHYPEHRLTFDQWLLAKRKSELVQRRQARRERQHQLQLRQLRKQIAEQSYADWLQLKRLSGQQAKVPRLSGQVSTEQTERCTQQWLQRKQHELQLQREQRQHVKELQELDDQLRDQLSQLAWQRWLTQRLAKSSQPSVPDTAIRAAGGGRVQASMPKQQRCKLQKQLASFYFHVPLSKAQRKLQKEH